MSIECDCFSKQQQRRRNWWLLYEIHMAIENRTSPQRCWRRHSKKLFTLQICLTTKNQFIRWIVLLNLKVVPNIFFWNTSLCFLQKYSAFWLKICSNREKWLDDYITFNFFFGRCVNACAYYNSIVPTCTWKPVESLYAQRKSRKYANVNYICLKSEHRFFCFSEIWPIHAP